MLLSSKTEICIKLISQIEILPLRAIIYLRMERFTTGAALRGSRCSEGLIVSKIGQVLLVYVLVTSRNRLIGLSHGTMMTGNFQCENCPKKRGNLNLGLKYAPDLFIDAGKVITMHLILMVETVEVSVTLLMTVDTSRCTVLGSAGKLIIPAFCNNIHIRLCLRLSHLAWLNSVTYQVRHYT